MKQIMAYDFLPDEELYADPIKFKAWTEALGMYDWSISAKIQLNNEVK